MTALTHSKSTGGAGGASPPRRGHAFVLKMAQLRRATMAESSWRKRLRSLPGAFAADQLKEVLGDVDLRSPYQPFAGSLAVLQDLELPRVRAQV